MPSPDDVFEQVAQWFLPGVFVTLLMTIWAVRDWFGFFMDVRTGAQQARETWREISRDPNDRITSILQAVGVWIYCGASTSFYVNWAVAGGGGSDFGDHGMDKFLALSAQALATPGFASEIFGILAVYATAVIAICFLAPEGKLTYAAIVIPPMVIAFCMYFAGFIHVAIIALVAVGALASGDVERLFPVLIITALFLSLGPAFTVLPFALMRSVLGDHPTAQGF